MVTRNKTRQWKMVTRFNLSKVLASVKDSKECIRSSSISSRGSVRSRASTGLKRDWFDGDGENAEVKASISKRRMKSPLKPV